ncbi:MAG TPA: PilX N-terminal domain-containing pilus assembly protein [Vicinamibacterales bacterium]|nr:PilX N-terminal domain-containing pilus assembly protein [Vicinamibacterales bacterium]
MRTSERGLALVVTTMAMLLLTALGAALILATGADLAIAANAGAASEAFAAAEAVFERTLAELRRAPDFTSVLDGSFPSAFLDGDSPGPRTLADGTRINLLEVRNLANCQKTTGCSEADLNAAIRDRPWGTRNPRWRLFSWGPVSRSASMLADAPPIYTVSLVADDPSETDADPMRDGGGAGPSANPGAGIVLVRAEALAGRGAHRIVEGLVRRHDLVARARWDAADPATRGPAPVSAPAVQVLTWREVR